MEQIDTILSNKYKVFGKKEIGLGEYLFNGLLKIMTKFLIP
jgi:hypothetical protein